VAADELDTGPLQEESTGSREPGLRQPVCAEGVELGALASRWAWWPLIAPHCSKARRRRWLGERLGRRTRPVLLQFTNGRHTGQGMAAHLDR
jgi:hypothetical protein